VGPGIDRLDEEDFAFEHVADTRHDALIGERFGYFDLGANPQAGKRFVN
jgi:hypothetical protein